MEFHLDFWSILLFLRFVFIQFINKHVEMCGQNQSVSRNFIIQFYVKCKVDNYN